MKNAPKLYSLPVLLLLGLPAVAHHSPAMFDLGQDVFLEGTIMDFSWRNPHVYIELNVTGPNGQVLTRRIEAGPASNFVALGVDGESLKPGERVIVQVKPNRGGASRTALGWLLTKADGTVIPLHVRAIPLREPGAAEASSLAGTWVPQGRAFADLAVSARTWPLTERGRAAIEATRAARDAARSQCVPFGPPALMALPSTVIVELSDSELTFRLDVMDAERIVHLDQTEHPVQLEPSLHGHSVGHWEGDTLVVDTTAYRAHPDGYAFDRPSSASKHVIERFTLAADRKHLNYEAVVEDSEYLAAPVTHFSQWDFRPEQTPSNLPCDPAVAGRFTEDD
jgi:hypothetical protein